MIIKTIMIKKTPKPQILNVYWVWILIESNCIGFDSDTIRLILIPNKNPKNKTYVESEKILILHDVERKIKFERRVLKREENQLGQWE